MEYINVYGAGLAGCEAAWQAAKRGVGVRLYEMKPKKMTPAHSYKGLCELVCSNSLRNNSIDSAIGLLKEELRRLGSLIMEAADSTKVSAGGALAVDRVKFSDYVTEKIVSCPNIELIEAERSDIPRGETTVIATGPLTSDAMAECIAEFIGKSSLYFYDAAAPIVSFDSIDMSKAFFASRYGKGDADYINCPMTREEYEAFYSALVNAETAPIHGFENADGDGKDEKGEKDITAGKRECEPKVFEGCMPVEVMAKRGSDTLRFGPLKPVGISHPVTGETYYAVVQLRRENEEGTMFNIVGFQTHLKFPEQRRVFGMIPGLENAEFLRYGVMHRNTFLNSPEILTQNYSVRERPEIFFAGQMTGVEGYIESAASGFVAGVSAAEQKLGRNAPIFPQTTMTGAMARYISRGSDTADFQPMNANFGIIPPPDIKVKGGKRARYAYYSERALRDLSAFAASCGLSGR